MASKNELIISINGSAKNLLDEMDKVTKKVESIDKVLTATAKASAAAFAIITAAVVVSTKAFADYETALVGVGKTTNFADERLKSFGREIQNLSKSIPIATNDLLVIAQAAAQLGVKGESDLLKFTETVAKLGVATDLSGQDAATALAQILGISGEAIGGIDRLGSVIVQLGNNFATTESKIARATNEVAKATASFAVGSTNAAAIATALSAMGVRSELAGSAVGRAFREIDAAIRQGGDKMRALQGLTGLTGDQLKKTFAEDSTQVFQLFLNGLKNVGQAGGDVTKTLEIFGLKGDEILKVLPSLAKNSELLGRAISLANQEYKDNNALNKESAAAFDTLNSRVQILKNGVVSLATDFGSRLAPDVKAVTEGLINLVAKIQSLDNSTKDAVVELTKILFVITGLVAGLAALGAAFTFLAPLVAGFGIIAAGAGLSMSGLLAVIAGGVVAVTALGKGFSTLLNADKGTTASSLDEVNAKLEKNRAQLEKQIALQKELGKEDDYESQRAIENLKLKIGLLEEQKKKLEETAKAGRLADQSFGTGTLLVTPQLTQAPTLDTTLPGATIPLKTDNQINAEKEKADLKQSEDDKNAIVNEAIQRRIELKKLEQEKILDDAQLARIKDADNISQNQKAVIEQEFAFEDQKRQIRAERLAAEDIENTTEREAAIANANLKYQVLLEQQDKFNIENARVNAEEQEREAVLNEEIRAADLEQTARLNQEDLDSLRAKLETEDEADRTYAKRKVERQIGIRNQYMQDERKFGTAVAEMKKFFASEEYQGVKSASAQLTQLRQSESKKQQEIGKAAARVQAAIKTAEGAIAAYTSLAPIPIVGPALGAAAAAALISFGLEQQRKIDSTPIAAARGGIVPPGPGGARDRIPALLQPGEAVVPAPLVPDFIQSVGRPEGGGGANGDSVVKIELTSDLIKFVEDKFQERRALGITSSGAFV